MVFSQVGSGSWKQPYAFLCFSDNFACETISVQLDWKVRLVADQYLNEFLVCRCIHIVETCNREPLVTRMCCLFLGELMPEVDLRNGMKITHKLDHCIFNFETYKNSAQHILMANEAKFFSTKLVTVLQRWNWCEHWKCWSSVKQESLWRPK